MTPARSLGTMVVHGATRDVLDGDLAIAESLGARTLEVLPDWRDLPDPAALRRRLSERGFQLHSAHGCWGGARTIRARRIDLGETDPEGAGLDDLRRCLDWLAEAGGTYLVIHPGGLSDPARFEARRAALLGHLAALADHAQGTGLVACVENMPPGVHPGSRMADLAAIVAELNRPEIALALDTGHAHIAESLTIATQAAGPLLRTTHVHDNDGRQDSHAPPGLGTIDWDAWIPALDAIGYTGPIMLECIRHLRERPESLDDTLRERLERLTATRTRP